MNQATTTITIFAKSASGRSVLVGNLVVPVDWNDNTILNWLFKITNAPFEALTDAEKAVLDTNNKVLARKIWSISVGDVFKLGSKTYCCYPVGWTETTEGKAKAYFAFTETGRTLILPAPVDEHSIIINRF